MEVKSPIQQFLNDQAAYLTQIQTIFNDRIFGYTEAYLTLGQDENLLSPIIQKFSTSGNQILNIQKSDLNTFISDISENESDLEEEIFTL